MYHRLLGSKEFVFLVFGLAALGGTLPGCRRKEEPQDARFPANYAPSPFPPQGPSRFVQGAAPAVEKAIVFPELGPARQMEPGVVRHDVVLGEAPLKGQVWVYLPEKKTKDKLPCILIAPAGSPLIIGMDLGRGDVAEHVPYVRAGFAVVAYAISGSLSADFANAHPLQRIDAMRTFMAAESGLVNAKRALDFALARVPEIDAARIYTAGHSSAATLSLFVAEKEPRIKACVAFAPAPEVVARVGQAVLQQLGSAIPGFAEFIARTSPQTNIAELRCPLFLFHARDDDVVPIGDSIAFVNELKKTNPNVTFVQAARGGHYEPMIKEGIPQAIRWLKRLPAK